jgi:hypothetical protein
MKALLRASIVCALSLAAAAALTACTRDAPNASASEQVVVASVVQPASDSDMPEVVVTASRSGKSALAREDSKAARRL